MLKYLLLLFTIPSFSQELVMSYKSIDIPEQYLYTFVRHQLEDYKCKETYKHRVSLYFYESLQFHDIDSTYRKVVLHKPLWMSNKVYNHVNRKMTSIKISNLMNTVSELTTFDLRNNKLFKYKENEVYKFDSDSNIHH